LFELLNKSQILKELTFLMLVVTKDMEQLGLLIAAAVSVSVLLVGDEGMEPSAVADEFDSSNSSLFKSGCRSVDIFYIVPYCFIL
jgi:hypothetical protein